jgi:hypothetical protein
MAQSEALSKVDDLRVCIIDLESDKLEALKLAKGSGSSSSKVGSITNMSKSTAQAILDDLYAESALSDDVKIGKHPKTTGMEKEGMAKFLTKVWNLAGHSGDFKAFNSAIIIPS